MGILSISLFAGYMVDLLLAITSGIAFRLGGYGKPFKRWYRWVICGVAVGFVHLQYGWWAIPVALLSGLSTTTYYKIGGQEDVLWYNWLLCGFVQSLVVLPITISHGLWLEQLIRSVCMPLLLLAVRQLSSNVWIEEIGHGIIIASPYAL